jgi:hypothetical protein
MEVIKVRLQYFQIEWDGPIIFVNGDKVTILSPLQILEMIDNASRKVRESIYQSMRSLSSREEMLSYLEKLGKRLLTIRI